jgi:hypothetical protein
MGFMDWLTGTLSQQDYNNIGQVQAPDASNYQIAGMQGYQNQLGSLGQQAAGNQINTAQAQQTRGQQEQNLGQLQAQANGTGPSYAQQFMQQNQQAALRSQQAQALSSQAGATPGLAYRGLMNAQGALQSQMASQGALMKVQEQQQAQQALAQQLTSVRSQDFGQAQGVAQQNSQNIQQQGNLAGMGFNANAQQTNNNMQMQNLQTQIQSQKRAQDLQQAQAQAAESGTLVKGLMGMGSSVLGGIATGGMMGLLGGGAGSFANGAGQAVSGDMLNSMGSNSQGNQYGTYVDPYSSNGSMGRQY